MNIPIVDVFKIIMSNKTKMRRLPMSKEYCEIIRDWFMFVDATQRTSVDSKLNHKIARAVIMMDTYPEKFDHLMMTEREVQTSSRWFYMIPDIVRDHRDDKIYRHMDGFLSKA